MSIRDYVRQSQSVRHSVAVEEWGPEGSPGIIYYGPLTAREINQIQRKHPGFINSTNFEGMVDLIIMKAQDEDGAKIFTLEDKPFLMSNPAILIGRIAGEMLSSSDGPEQAGNA